MEDRSFVSTGKPESWTYKGMKVYDYQCYFTRSNEFIETFICEDGLSYEFSVPKHQWTEEMKRKAKEQGIIK